MTCSSCPALAKDAQYRWFNSDPETIFQPEDEPPEYLNPSGEFPPAVNPRAFSDESPYIPEWQESSGESPPLPTHIYGYDGQLDIPASQTGPGSGKVHQYSAYREFDDQPYIIADQRNIVGAGGGGPGIGPSGYREFNAERPLADSSGYRQFQEVAGVDRLPGSQPYPEEYVFPGGTSAPAPTGYGYDAYVGQSTGTLVAVPNVTARGGLKRMFDYSGWDMATAVLVSAGVGALILGPFVWTRIGRGAVRGAASGAYHGAKKRYHEHQRKTTPGSAYRKRK